MDFEFGYYKGKKVIRSNFTDIDEARAVFTANLEAIYKNPRYFLDKLDTLPEFRVPWYNYHRKKTKHL